MSNTEQKNCRDRCPYTKLCRAEGSADTDPWECANADRIMDFILESKYEPDDEYEEEKDE